MIAFIVAIFILSFLIFIHELGHFLAAKKANILVEEFGFGYPPRIFGKKIGETIYSLNIIPFGGFVKIRGESGPLEDKNADKRSFFLQKPKMKAKILLAGVLANAFLAVVIFYFILISQNFSFHLPSFYNHRFIFGEQKSFPAVALVLDDSPAQESGLRIYDLIISANDQYISGARQFIDFINQRKGETVALHVRNLNDNLEKTIMVSLPINAPDKKVLGAGIQDMINIRYNSGLEKIFSGFFHSINIIDYSFAISGNLIKQSFATKEIAPLANLAVGPVGIIALTKNILSGGVLALLNFLAIFSLGLALVNVLPIPAADGGRLVFVAYEAIFKKTAPPKFERNFNLVGYIFLIVLSIIIAAKDIIQFRDILFK